MTPRRFFVALLLTTVLCWSWFWTGPVWSSRFPPCLVSISLDQFPGCPEHIFREWQGYRLSFCGLSVLMEELCWGGGRRKRPLDEWRPVKGYVLHHDHVDRAQVRMERVHSCNTGGLTSLWVCNRTMCDHWSRPLDQEEVALQNTVWQRTLDCRSSSTPTLSSCSRQPTCPQPGSPWEE